MFLQYRRQRNIAHYLEEVKYRLSSNRRRRHNNAWKCQPRAMLTAAKMVIRSVSVANVLCLIVRIGWYRVDCALVTAPSVKLVLIQVVKRT